MINCVLREVKIKQSDFDSISQNPNIKDFPGLLLYGKNHDSLEYYLLRLISFIKKTEGDVQVSYFGDISLNSSSSNKISLSEALQNLDSMDLFCSKKICILYNISDTKQTFEVISSHQFQNNIFIIVHTENINKSSKLRKFFEDSKNLVSIPIYEESQESLFKITMKEAEKYEVVLSKDITTRIIDLCGSNILNLSNEIKKISVITKTPSLSDIEKFIYFDSKDLEINEIINSIMEGSYKKYIPRIFNYFLVNKNDAIPFLRLFSYHLYKLYNVINDIDNGLSFGQAYAKNGVLFFKYNSIKKQMSNLNKSICLQKINEVSKIEDLIKYESPSSIMEKSDIILIENFIINFYKNERN